MADIKDTLHPEGHLEYNLYPNIKADNVPNNSLGKIKLDSEVNSLLKLVGANTPSGATTSSTILAKTSDQGLWVGTDTGKWYYWNGSKYVAGGTWSQNVDPLVANTIQNKYGDIIASSSNTQLILGDDALNVGITTNYEFQLDVGDNSALIASYDYETDITTTKITHGPLQVDEVDNSNGNAMLRYKSTENKVVVGTSEKPLTLMGSGDRPTYSKDGSDFEGKELAFQHEVATKIYSSFEKGTIGSEGVKIDTDKRCRTKEYIYLKKGQVIYFKHTYKYNYNVMEYDVNGILVKDHGWTSNAYWIAPQDLYVKIVIKKAEEYLNLINRAVSYWHRNDVYEVKNNRIIFDLKDVSAGDVLTLNSSDGQRYSLSTFDTPYKTASTAKYVYDSGWIASGTTLVHTIESNAKCAVIASSMLDNSDFSDKSWLLNPNISVRKNNDEVISETDLTDIETDGLCIANIENFVIERNNISNSIIQWAHRGYTEYAPENTIPSFEMSYKFGLRCMECDVRLTKDNIPVILHDTTINRTARNLDGSVISSTLNVVDLPLADLQNMYDFGVWFSDKYKGTKILTFEELIKWCKVKDCYLQIDLTGDAIKSTSNLSILYDIVSAYSMQDKVVWEVINTDFVTWLQNKKTDVDIIFNPSAVITTSNIDTIVSLGLNKMSTKVDTPYSTINYANSQGLKTFIWSATPISVTNSNILKYYKYGVCGFYTSLQDVHAYLEDYEYVLSQRKDV